MPRKKSEESKKTEKPAKTKKPKTEKVKEAKKVKAAPTQVKKKVLKDETEEKAKPKRKPASGLLPEKMNSDEQKVVLALKTADHPLSIKDLAELAFHGVGKNGKKDSARANSRVRNALRRLRAFSWVFPAGKLGGGTWRGHWMDKATPSAPTNVVPPVPAPVSAPTPETVTQ